MKPIKVLFICIHNSARSQMAEAYLTKFGGENFIAESAGLEPGKLNPLAVKSLLEDGIDISQNKTKDVFEMHRRNLHFDYVVTVCDAGNSERCPVFPGAAKKIAWEFADPSAFTGSDEEKLAQTNVVREKIKATVKDFIAEVLNSSY